MSATEEFRQHCATCDKCQEAQFSFEFCEVGQRLWELHKLEIPVNVLLPLNAFGS